VNRLRPATEQGKAVAAASEGIAIPYALRNCTGSGQD